MFEVRGRRIGGNADCSADFSPGACPEPFVIAELSANHQQSLARALQLVEAAATAGAHAVKLQTYTPERMTLDVAREEYRVGGTDNPWNGRALFELYREAQTPWEWHAPLFAHAQKLGMLAFSTPYDESAVDFLESLDVPLYKIASFEITDLALIRKAAATGKPLLMSTGMASVAELDEAVRTAREAGCRDLVLLKCTSSYPADPCHINLRSIPHLRELFGCEVGLSDHTLGCGVAVAAVALGAVMIEKHFTLARSEGGVDATFSAEPQELALLVSETKRARQALGKVVYGAQSESERRSLAWRRSLHVVRDIASGEEVSRENVAALRPGLGLAPKYLPQVLGRRARCPISRGTPLDWSLLS